MIGAYHVLGMSLSVSLIFLTASIGAIYKFHKKDLYVGYWCDLCFCLNEGKSRKLFVFVYKILFGILIAFVLSLAVIRILCLVNIAQWSLYPTDCVAHLDGCYRVDAYNQGYKADTIIDLQV